MGANCSNLEYSDLNVTVYVVTKLGPRCLQNGVLVSTAFIYTLILLLGLFGNLMTCIVTLRVKAMHSATTCYLFSLAVSDLVSLILGVPFELHSSITGIYPYTLPWFVCKSRGFLTEASTYASVLTILAFSAERWLAICYPLTSHTLSRIHRAVKALLLIWCLAFLSAIPLLCYIRINRLLLDNPDLASQTDDNSSWLTHDGYVKETELCAMDMYDLKAQAVLIHVSFWLFFVCPFLIMTVLFFHIGIVLHRADMYDTVNGQKRRIACVKHDAKQAVSRRMVIRMLLAVVVAFFICFLPFHIQRLMIIHVENWDSVFVQKIFNAVFYISGYFYYANSAVNPLLYNAFNRKFRTAFINTICCVESTNHELRVSGEFTSAVTALMVTPFRFRASDNSPSARCQSVTLPAAKTSKAYAMGTKKSLNYEDTSLVGKRLRLRSSTEGPQTMLTKIKESQQRMLEEPNEL